MKRGMIRGAIVCLCLGLGLGLSLLGCVTHEAADVSQAPVNIPFTVADDFGQGITIHAVTAQEIGNRVEFRFDYTSDVQRGMSFFDPPAGDIISIQEVLPAGDQSVVILVRTSNLRKVNYITINFYIPAVELTGSIFLDFPVVAALVGGHTTAGESSVSETE